MRVLQRSPKNQSVIKRIAPGTNDRMYQIPNDAKRLLNALIEDGRASQKEVGVRLGFSAKKMSELISRLMRDGIISRFTARLNYAKLGYVTEGFLLFKAMTKAPGDIEQIIRSCSSIPFVIEMHQLFGREYD